MPKTYLGSVTSTKVTVCKNCDWLSHGFCMALVKGRLDEAKAFVETGNINIRSNFADIDGEAIFPVHAAVIGGNVNILRWLVDTLGCPISTELSTGSLTATKSTTNQSLRTSKGRSLIDLALNGKKKPDIVRYLIVEKKLSVKDSNNTPLLLNAIDNYIRQSNITETEQLKGSPPVLVIDEEQSSVSTSLNDQCCICFERPFSDCVLTPCGHQMCCFKCGQHLDKCPICKVPCSPLKVFR